MTERRSAHFLQESGHICWQLLPLQVLSFSAMQQSGYLYLTDSISRHPRLLHDDYFSPYLNDLDIYSLEENAASLAIPEQGPDVSKAEIIEYLVLENIEISEIYEQL